MKVIRNTYNFRNVLVFILLSVVFLISIHGLSIGSTVLSKIFLLKTLKENYLIFLLCLLTFYFTLTFKKFSEWLLLIFIVLTVFKSLLFLSNSFNKLILALDFVYLIFAFYFFTIWEIFNTMASHNPNFSKIDLEKETRFKIVGEIQNELKTEFLLTNIDEDGCFVMLKTPLTSNIELSDQVSLQVRYEGVSFSSIGTCVSKYDIGLGFSFKNDTRNLRSLSGLHQVCLDRGII